MPEPTVSESSAKRLKNWLLLILVIALVGWTLFFFYKPTKDKAVPTNTGGGQGGPKGPVKVQGMLIATEPLSETIFSPGTLLSGEEAVLRAELAGRVTAIHFREGAAVSKGDLLVKMNDADLIAQLSKLESQLTLQQENADRQKQLLDINGISRQEYDEALNRVTATRADISFTRAQIAKTEIRAPFSGVIGLRSISVGSMVNTTDAVASLQQLHPLRLDFSIPEKYSAFVRRGDSVRFTIGGSEENHIAVIDALEPKIDPATRSVKIRALANNHGHTMLPGAFAKVMFTIGRKGEAILIPTSTVIPVLKGKKVMVVKNGVALSQPVTTGVRRHADIEITGGLNPGDTLLTSALMQLRDSMVVNVSLK